MAGTYNTLILNESSLVAYWELEDAAASTTAADSKGTNTLTVSGTVTFASAPLITTSTTGKAAAFTVAGSGNLHSGTSPNSGVINSTSYDCWFKWTVGSTVNQNIFRVGNGSTNGIGVYINGNGTNDKQLYVLALGLAWHGTAYTVDGNVHHLGVTISSGGVVKVYIDGQLVFSSSFSINAPSGGMDIVSAPADITVSQVAAYSSELSAAAVARHWLAGLATPTYAVKQYRPRPNRLTVAGQWRQNLLAASVLRGYTTASPVDAAFYNKALSLNGDTSWGTGCFGDEVTFPGSTGFLKPATAIDLSGLTQFTVAVLASLNIAALGTINASNLAGIQLVSQESNSTVALRFFVSSADSLVHLQIGGASATPSAQKPVSVDPVLYVGRFNAGTLDLFFGGVKVATAATGLSTVTSSSGLYYVGNRDAGGTNNTSWWGGIQAHYLWSRALSDQEIAALAADVFAPVRPNPSRAWMPGAVTSGMPRPPWIIYPEPISEDW